MKNGLYKIEFEVNGACGTGVGHLTDGKFYGGDSMIYYIGSYSVENTTFQGTVKTNAHSVVPGMSSVFGINSVNIKLSGTVNGDVIQVNGTAQEAPNAPFKAKLILISQ